MRVWLTIITILIFAVSSLTAFFIWNDFVKNSPQDLHLRSVQADIEIADRDSQIIMEPVVTPVSEPNYLPIRDFNISDPEIAAKAALLYDKYSGRILYAKNTDDRLPIASITKLMTAVMVIEHLDMDRIVAVSVENLNVDGYGADLYENEKIYISDLLKMLLIKSSNDAALALADRARERGIDFEKEMNKKALELGMINTRFIDPAGLSDEAFSTASDLLKLIKYAKKYDIIWQTTLIGQTDVTSTDGKVAHRLNSTNKLLGQIPNIIGGKTGFTDGAGQTMLLIVSHENSELVSIVLGTEDRFGETRKLIEWGIKAHRWQ